MTNSWEKEVQQRIERITAPEKRFSLSLFEKRTKYYEGKLTGSYFQISRIIGYRNANLPIIKG